MGIASRILIPNAIPAQAVTDTSLHTLGTNGTLDASGVNSYIGSTVGGLLQGMDKFSCYVTITGLVGQTTVNLYLDGSADGTNFTSGGKLAMLNPLPNANGTYDLSYNDSTVSMVKFTVQLTGTDHSCTIKIALESSPM